MLTYVKRRIAAKTGNYGAAVNEGIRISEYTLKRLRDSVEQSGARLLVVVIGYCFDGMAEHLWIENTIVESCRSNRIEFLNMPAEMRGRDFESFYLAWRANLKGRLKLLSTQYLRLASW